MDNAVVASVGRALVRVGLAVLRFNFGGVGRSQGGHSGGPREVEDAKTALAALADRLPAAARLALVGYSFGAWVALQAATPVAGVERVVAIAPPFDLLDWSFLEDIVCPIVCIVGDRDQFCSASRLARIVTASSGRIVAHPIPGADHFLAGKEQDVAEHTATALSSL